MLPQLPGEDVGGAPLPSRRRARAGHLAVAALVAALATAAPAPTAPAAKAGVVCGPEVTCGHIRIDATGNGTGTITGGPFDCSATHQQQNICEADIPFGGDFVLVELTMTPAKYSVYIAAVGDTIPYPESIKESVLLTKTTPDVVKEVLFRLGNQEMQLGIGSEFGGSIE